MFPYKPLGCRQGKRGYHTHGHALSCGLSGSVKTCQHSWALGQMVKAGIWYGTRCNLPELHDQGSFHFYQQVDHKTKLQYMP